MLVGDLKRRGEVLALLAPESVERTDHSFLNERAKFVLGHLAIRHDFVDAKFAALGLAGVEFLGLLERGGAAKWAGGFELRVNAFLDGLGVGLGLPDDLLGEIADLLHEDVPLEFVALHLAELVFPLARHFGGTEGLDPDLADLLDEGQPLAGDVKVAAFALNVAEGDEAFDDRCPGGRGAKSALAHGFGQFVVLDQLSRTFHHGEEGGFGVAGRRLGLKFLHLDVERAGGFALLGGDDQPAAFLLLVVVGLVVRVDGFLAVDTEPARFDEDLAIGLEGIVTDAGDAGGDFELSGREKDGDEAPGDHVEELLLRLGQFLGRHQSGWDDGKVIADLGVVENAFVRTHPVVGDDGGRVGNQVGRKAACLSGIRLRDGLHVIDHGAEVILGEVA